MVSSTDTSIFYYIPKYFYFKYHPQSDQSKYFIPLFHLIKSSTKVIEFDHVKFPVSISSEDGVSREFFEIDSNSMFSKR